MGLHSGISFIVPSPSAPTNTPRMSGKSGHPDPFYSRKLRQRNFKVRGRAWGLSSWSSFCPHSGWGLACFPLGRPADHRQLRKSPSTALRTSGEADGGKWKLAGLGAVSEETKQRCP